MGKLFDAFEHGAFIVPGIAVCDREATLKDDSRVKLQLEDEIRFPLVISNHSAGRDTAPRFSFSILKQDALSQLLAPRKGIPSQRFSMRAHYLGHVEHSIGRSSAADYNEGRATSQKITSLDGISTFSVDGLALELFGELAAESWLGQATDPRVVRNSFAVSVRVPWEVLRFLFRPVTVASWHEQFGHS